MTCCLKIYDNIKEAGEQIGENLVDLIENTFIGEMDASESEKKAQIKLSASLCSKVRPRSIRELAIFNVFHFQFYLKVSLSN